MLKPEIVMQACRRVLLHDEHSAGVFHFAAGRFVGFLEVALFVVVDEVAHACASAAWFLLRGHETKRYFFARLAGALAARGLRTFSAAAFCFAGGAALALAFGSTISA